MLYKIIDSKSKTFIAFCFCFLSGIIVAGLINKKIDFVYLYFLLFVIISFVIIFRHDKKWRFIFVGILFFIFAFSRYNLALPKNSDKYIHHYNGENIEITGFVSSEPDIRSDSVKYIVQSSEPIGRVYFKSELYPRYEYGDKLKLKCDLFAPEPIEDFRYDMYLARFGVFSICGRPQIEVLHQNDAGQGNLVLKNIFKFKQSVAERVNQLWHEPYAGFVAGLLYGYRGGLGELQEDLNRTGVTHIVAISGYNISIIASILMIIFVYLWIPRKRAFWLISFGILVFVLFAGASGSVVRAGIMGFLVLLAKQLGRLNRMNNALALTAVLMTLHNPYVLLWDAGFQLSFLATMGLIYLAPILHIYFYKIPEFFGFRESFISTISAIIVTLPLILYQFGRLSIVAPIVNVLILWIIPWIMLFGFFSVILSFIFFPLGQVFSWITFVGLKYITSIVEWFSSLSFASIDLQIPLWLVLVLYIGLVFLIKKICNYIQSSV